MQLTKELKTNNFESEFQKTLVNIIFTYHWSSQKLKDILTPYDITQQQYNVLRILRTLYPSPSTMNLIQARILDKVSDTSRIVDRLIQKEYVEKTVNPYDKRAVDIIISNKGLALLRKMDKEVDLSAFISPNLTVEEAEQLNELLNKMRGI
jgi:DNA-binding MarR family transcriptional regulator